LVDRELRWMTRSYNGKMGKWENGKMGFGLGCGRCARISPLRRPGSLTCAHSCFIGKNAPIRHGKYGRVSMSFFLLRARFVRRRASIVPCPEQKGPSLKPAMGIVPSEVSIVPSSNSQCSSRGQRRPFLDSASFFPRTVATPS
jgi:hypothetical protein